VQQLDPVDHDRQVAAVDPAGRAADRAA